LTEPFPGQFWVAGNPNVQVHGELTVNHGGKIEVQLDDRLVDDPRVRKVPGGVAWTSSAIDSVESFQPITLHGQLDRGESVTVLHAQNYGSRGLSSTPLYRGYTVVSGDEHVTGDDQLYNSVRFRMDHPYWLGHIGAGQSSVVPDDQSVLRIETAEDGNWLEYSSATPATLRQLEIRVLSGCLVLAQLAIGLEQELVTRETEVRLDPDSAWLAVQGMGVSAPLGSVDPEMLLPREVLTVERFANWIALNDKLDGLAWVVARSVKGPVQQQVLVVTPLIEGLHRRLPYEQSKFPNATRGAIDRIKQVARRSTKEKAADESNLDPEKVRLAIMNAVSHFDAVDYLDRATDIVNEVCTVVPEIAESVAELPERLTQARNDMAHHLLQDETTEPLAIRYLRWLVAANVTPWLLRCLLLLHAGIEPEVVRQGLSQYQRFEFFRANTAQHVRELGWTLPAANDSASARARVLENEDNG
jgi:hypothetical protein